MLLTPTLSVVVPCSKESFEAEVSSRSDLEVIWVDLKEAQSRAMRLNLGFHRSTGKVVLFHHPRSRLSKGAIDTLIDLAKKRDDLFWGGFTHAFDDSHPLLRFTSWYSNRVRARRGILYLDHCIFFERRLFQDLPDREIFEDTVLSQCLRKVAKPVLLREKSVTSSIRFRRGGIYRHSLTNQLLKLAYFIHLPDRLMNRFYEKKAPLNSPRSHDAPIGETQVRSPRSSPRVDL